MGLMPSPDEMEGWAPGESMSFRGESLFDHIDGGADIYFEYGFTTLVTQEYEKEDKAVSIEIYCMDNPSSAYGIYSYSRHPTLSPAEVGSEGTIHPRGIFFWQDRYYVDVRQMKGPLIHGEEFLSLAKAIEKKIETKVAKPAAMSLLPPEKMIPRSEVLALGPLGIDNQVFVANEDLFRLGKGEVAAIGRYRLGEPEFSIVIARYANPDACGQAFARFREHFLGAESTREDEFTTKAMPGKFHGVRTAGDKLIVVANADSTENAMMMLTVASQWLESSTGSVSSE